MEHTEDRYRKKILTVPNALSFFRLCLIPVIVWQYVAAQNYTAALVLVALSGLTDVVDGFIARRFHMVSDFGKIFDPIADKLTQIAVLFCLVTRFPAMWVCLILLIVKELFSGITGLLMVRRGIVIGADWHGKLTTVLLYAAMLVHLAWVNITPEASALLISACAVMILLSGVLYGIRNLRCLLGKQAEP